MSVAWFIGLSLNLGWSCLWAIGSVLPTGRRLETDEVKHVNHMTLVAWFNGWVTLMLLLGSATGAFKPWLI